VRYADANSTLRSHAMFSIARLIADQVGVTESTISNWEQGRNSLICLERRDIKCRGDRVYLLGRGCDRVSNRNNRSSNWCDRTLNSALRAKWLSDRILNSALRAKWLSHRTLNSALRAKWLSDRTLNSALQAKWLSDRTLNSNFL